MLPVHRLMGILVQEMSNFQSQGPETDWILSSSLRIYFSQPNHYPNKANKGFLAPPKLGKNPRMDTFDWSDTNSFHTKVAYPADSACFEVFWVTKEGCDWSIVLLLCSCVCSGDQNWQWFSNQHASRVVFGNACANMCTLGLLYWSYPCMVVIWQFAKITW